MVNISRTHLDALRLVAKNRFDPASTTATASATNWKLTDGDAASGYFRFDIDLLAGESARSLVVEISETEKKRFAFVGLYCFPELPDREEQIPAFDQAFRFVAEQLEQILGKSTAAGRYSYPHRTWDYSYCWWSLPEAELALVQDEFDIQDGLDVTLWIFPAGYQCIFPLQ